MPNQKDMFIHGGWSNIGQFSNLYVYQVDNNTWIEVNINMDLPRWNHSAILIPALPRWKLFFFGGSSGYFDEGQPRTFGGLTNQSLYITLEESLEES